MHPPHDAHEARCGHCQQTVTTAVTRRSPDGAVLLCTCPHCGAVWSAWPAPTPLAPEGGP